MGMGRKKKKAIIKKVLLILASAASLAAAITTFRAWRTAGTDREPLEETAETGRTGTEGRQETQQEITAWDDGDETAPETTGAGDTEPAKKETQAKGTERTEDKEKEGGTESTETEKETERKYAVTILNKDEFAKQVMASRTYLLDKYLSSYVEKKKMKADEGTILDVAVALDDAHCTEFFVELNNKRKSLVTLRWDPYKCTVKASKCQYTKEEVRAAIWADGDAAVRDISREEDAALIEGLGGEQTETQTEPAEPESGRGEEVILE